MPGFDLVGGIAGLGLAGLVAMTESAVGVLEGDPANHGTSGTIGVASAILVASSIYGFGVAKDCRRAHDRYRASVRMAQPGPAYAPVQP
jgi:hypothetical protein